MAADALGAGAAASANTASANTAAGWRWPGMLGPLEAVQINKPRAIGVDCEHRAIAPNAATTCRPIECVAR